MAAETYENEVCQTIIRSNASDSITLNNCEDMQVTGAGGNDTVIVNGGQGNKLYLITEQEEMVTESLVEKVQLINDKYPTLEMLDNSIYYRPIGAGTNKLTINESKNSVVLFGNGTGYYTLSDSDNNWMRAGNGANTVKAGNGYGNVVIAGYGENVFSLTDENADVIIIDGSASDTGKNNTVNVIRGNDNIVYLDKGADKVNLTNTAGALVYGMGGNDKIIVKGSSESFIDSGIGNDSITISGSENIYVAAGAGSDKITIDFASLTGDVELDMSGNELGNVDTVLLNNLRFADVEMGGTAEKITLSYGGKTVTLKGLDAEDKLSTVKFGDSTRMFAYLVGLMNGELIGSDKADNLLVNMDGLLVKAGKGNDKLTLKEFKDTQVLLEAGNNTATLSGDENTIIYGGVGSDIVKATDSKNLTYEAVEEKLGKDTITLTNVEKANISTGIGKDSINLNNTKDADIYAGLGNDKITVKYSQDVRVNGGEGADTVTLTDSINVKLDAGAGNDIVTVKGGSDIYVAAGAGSDKITIDFASLTGDVELDMSGNELGNVDTVLLKNLRFADVEMGGTAEKITLSYGGKTVTLKGLDAEDKLSTVKFGDSTRMFAYLVGLMNGELIGSDKADNLLVNMDGLLVKAGKGNDKLTLKKFKYTQVLLEAGNNTAALSGDENTIIYGGIGSDIVKATDSKNLTYEAVEEKLGKDTITLTNVEKANVSTGIGKDSINLNYTKDADIYAGLGNDKITVKYSQDVRVNGGEGADTVTLTDSINVKLDAGAGNDIVTVKGGSDIYVAAGAGSDKITIDFASLTGDVELDMSGNELGNVDTILLNNLRFADVEIGGTAEKITLSYGDKTVSLKGLDENDSSSLVKFKDTSKSYAYLEDLMHGVLRGTDGANNLLVNRDGLTVYACKGNDTVTMTKHKDAEIFLETGSNTVTFNEAEDTIVHGGSGVDTIKLNDSNNISIDGGAGNDIIYVNSGVNYTIAGGSGNDKIIVDWSQITGDIVIDNSTAELTDNDLLQFKNANADDFKFVLEAGDLKLQHVNGNCVSIEGWADKPITNLQFADKKLSAAYINENTAVADPEPKDEFSRNYKMVSLEMPSDGISTLNIVNNIDATIGLRLVGNVGKSSEYKYVYNGLEDTLTISSLNGQGGIIIIKNYADAGPAVIAGFQDGFIYTLKDDFSGRVEDTEAVRWLFTGQGWSGNLTNVSGEPVIDLTNYGNDLTVLHKDDGKLVFSKLIGKDHVLIGELQVGETMPKIYKYNPATGGGEFYTIQLGDIGEIESFVDSNVVFIGSNETEFITVTGNGSYIDCSGGDNSIDVLGDNNVIACSDGYNGITVSGSHNMIYCDDHESMVGIYANFDLESGEELIPNNNSVILGDASNLVDVSAGNNNLVVGGDLDDTVYVSDGTGQKIETGAGDDFIYVLGGNQITVDGGTDSDYYYIGALLDDGIYVVDQNSAGKEDYDVLSLDMFESAEFSMEFNKSGDLEMTHDSSGAVIKVVGWKEHALGAIVFSDKEMSFDSEEDVALSAVENNQDLVKAVQEYECGFNSEAVADYSQQEILKVDSTNEVNFKLTSNI